MEAVGGDFSELGGDNWRWSFVRLERKLLAAAVNKKRVEFGDYLKKEKMNGVLLVDSPESGRAPVNFSPKNCEH
ncbi:hypothetical protein KY285_023718 [Solanum tuberosum]|nr:hypothetical protein KY289_024048 [Solanum tuberosum]KAH0675917.1 hypothetical protein KY285_023718 [Solanum tuberosum]